jgi:molybdate-binding protein/DNA-binding XRE family transcriptional regulator
MSQFETRTQLSEIRQRRGVSASELARLTGVSRQTIYSIEAGEYVPNTALALQFARILEVRVEDLFSLDPESAPAPKPVPVEFLNSDSAAAKKGQPVQLCRVGKQMIAVPANAQPLTLPLADGIVVRQRAGHADVQTFPDSDNPRRLLIAGCDPGISLLAQHLDLVIAPSSSQQALDWLKQGKVHVAGTHLRDTSSGEYNLPAIDRLFPRGAVKVVTFAVWEQGFVLEAGNPKNVRAIDDMVRRDVRIVNREEGAGSRALLDDRLKAAGIAPEKVRGYSRCVPGHLPAALAVSLKEADCAIATRSAARAFGLDFIPLAVERYDLVIRRENARSAAVEAMLDTLNRAAIRRKLEILAGYDTTHTGEILLT